MEKSFIWLGTTGYNPKVGAVVTDKPVSIRDKQLQDFLLNSGLIKPVESKTLSRKKDERKEKAGKTAEKSTSGTTGKESGTVAGTGSESGTDAGTGSESGTDAGTGSESGTDAGTEENGEQLAG